MRKHTATGRPPRLPAEPRWVTCPGSGTLPVPSSVGRDRYFVAGRQPQDLTAYGHRQLPVKVAAYRRAADRVAVDLLGPRIEQHHTDPIAIRAAHG